MFLYIIWLVVILLLISFFAGIESAFVSSNKLGIELRKKQGKTSGIILSRFLDEPYKLIGTCLVGVTISTVLFAILLSGFLNDYVWKFTTINDPFLLLILNTAIAAVLIIIVVQVILRPVFRAKSDFLLAVSARVISFFQKIFYPVATVFVNLSAWLLKYIFNVRVNDKNLVLDKIDLEHFYHQNKIQDDDTQELNTELFENALSLPNVKIRQCLIPRTEIEGADIKLSIGEIKK